jgi:GT2 family glycosyltransferase
MKGVSIIIINYNTFDLTCQCIESIYKQTKTIDFEIILVDNASYDRPVEDFKQLFPNIILIESRENVGFAKGNNLAIPYAKSEVILLLNSDTVICNDAIGIAYLKMRESPAIGALSAKLTYPNGKIQNCANKFPSIKAEIIELLRLQKFVSPSIRSTWLLGYFFDHQTEKEVDWVWGTFFMIRKEVIAKFPGEKLNDDFFMYGEDMQWCFEIRKLGYNILYFPKAEVIHYLSYSTTRESTLDKKKLMIHHEYIFLNKYYGATKAAIIFKLRAIKYFSLIRYNSIFKQYAKLYFDKKNWK